MLAELRDADPEGGGLPRYVERELAAYLIAVVTDPTLTRTLLVALDLPYEPSAFAPARDPPQVELAWDDLA
jgi:hypothetical protein